MKRPFDENEVYVQVSNLELRCKNCTWYHPQDMHPAQGECREHAPDHGWDIVTPDDWCGDFELCDTPDV